MKDRKNNLDTRREFYIHRVVRNGVMYDEDEEKSRKAPDNKSTISSVTPETLGGKKPISYAESFGYREDPSRYDSFRANKTPQDKKVEEPVYEQNVSYMEEPLEDKTIGYTDEGVVVEEDDYYDQIDQYYVPEEENDTIMPVIEDEPLSHRELYSKPIQREDIKPVVTKVERSTTSINQNIEKSTVINRAPVERPTIVTKQQVERSSIVTKPTPKKKVKYVAPSYDLLTKSDASNAENIEEANLQKEIINKTFEEAGIRAEVEKFIFGPTVTQFLITIEKGANVKDIRRAESNLLMYLQCESIRIQTPIPGKPYAGIEVPKKHENRRIVYLGDMLTSKEFKNLRYQVPVAVGQDNYGNYHYIDLTEMPHGLIAGTTKSGKSVCLNAFLLSLIYRFTPSELRLVLIDPKRIELGIYDGIPHLAMPVITDQEDFQSALGWVYDEMEKRYKEFEVYGERNIVDYNEVRKQNNESIMPYIIVMMDEFSDWFADASSDIESYMQKLAQKARAAGINILLATQRPSKDVIKGTIKANFDTRIAFRVTSFEDAKVILGNSGAEKLEGHGDMLIRYSGRAEQRLQGAFVKNEDIKRVTRFLKENNTCDYLVTKEEIHQATVSRDTSSGIAIKGIGREDERFEEVAYYIVRNKNASVNQLTQIFSMGFNRVNDIVKALITMGVISNGVKGKQREVLVDEFEFERILEQE